MTRPLPTKGRPQGPRDATAVYDHDGADPEKQAALCDWGRRVEQVTGGETENARYLADDPARLGTEAIGATIEAAILRIALVSIRG